MAARSDRDGQRRPLTGRSGIRRTGRRADMHIVELGAEQHGDSRCRPAALVVNVGIKEARSGSFAPPTPHALP